MKADSQYLQAGVTQISLAIAPAMSMDSAMKVRQNTKMTINGSSREKTSSRLLEALFISVCLLSLFLAGCSPSMTARPASQREGAILRATGEATIPPHADVLNAPSGETAPSVSDYVGDPATVAFFDFTDAELTQERVRLVIGWLRFVKQAKVMRMVEEGWERVRSKKLVVALNNTPVARYPNISMSELTLWRQVLAVDPVSGVTSDSRMESQLESLAVVLALALNPDDLNYVDDVLIVPSDVAVY